MVLADVTQEVLAARIEAHNDAALHEHLKLKLAYRRPRRAPFSAESVVEKNR